LVILGRIRRAAADLDAVDTVLVLTLLLLLLRPIGVGFVRPSILLLAGAGLLRGSLKRSPTLWLTLAALTAWRVVSDWPLADNHAYLLSYWCLAIGLALRSADPAVFLAANGRRLIALAFGFAVLWKVFLSPDYIDGTFFRVTLLSDPRFETVTRLVGGLSPDLLERARVALWQHVDGLAPSLEVPPLPGRFEVLGTFLTLWTVALEALVAVAFLVSRQRAAGVRDALLLVFCATTYSVTPTIASFGWLLLAMGVAQCDSARALTRLSYLFVFGLILVCRELSWATG
jgi:hypothetical protein